MTTLDINNYTITVPHDMDDVADGIKSQLALTII